MSTTIGSGHTKLGRLGISAVVLLAGLATPNPARADVIVVNNTTIEVAKDEAEETTDVVGTISNFYGAYQAFAAAMNWLQDAMNPASPDNPEVTNNQIYDAILNTSSDANLWSIILRRNDIASALETGLEYASDCTGPADCDVRILGSRISSQDGVIKNLMTTLTVDGLDGTALFLRPSNNNLVLPPQQMWQITDNWQNAISARAAVINGQVFDWRGGVPYFLSWITQRLVFMEIVNRQWMIDNNVNYMPNDVQTEISHDITVLQALRDKMRGGIQCGLGYALSNNTSNCSNANLNPVFPTEYCADIYSGTFAMQRLTSAVQCGNTVTSAQQAAATAAVNNLRRAVYDATPLFQIEHLISMLSLWLNPHNHGFLIRTDSGTAEPLYVNAWGGAWEGTVLKAHWICDTSNTDCTWHYKDGMLISDSNNYGVPLAIMVAGSQLKLTSQCTPSIDACVWVYDKGTWTPRGTPATMGLLDGPSTGSRVGVGGATSFTWSMPNVMFTPSNLPPPQMPQSYAMRATGADGTGDAQEGGQIISDASCVPNNPNCTWTVNQGLILNDKNSSLGLNAWYGAGSGLLTTTQWCDISNTWNRDCTWRFLPNQIGTDNGNEFISYNVYGGDNTMSLPNPCTGGYCFLASTNFSITRAAD